MKEMLQKASIQLRLNRSGQHEMEKDAKDKHSAHMLDDRMHQMRNSTMGIGLVFILISTKHNKCRRRQKLRFSKRNKTRKLIILWT